MVKAYRFLAVYRSGGSDFSTNSSYLVNVLAILIKISVKNSSPRSLSISNKNLIRVLDFSGNLGVSTNSFPVPESNVLQLKANGLSIPACQNIRLNRMIERIAHTNGLSGFTPYPYKYLGK